MQDTEDDFKRRNAKVCLTRGRGDWCGDTIRSTAFHLAAQARVVNYLRQLRADLRSYAGAPDEQWPLLTEKRTDLTV